MQDNKQVDIRNSFYLSTPPPIEPATRELFESYCGIEPEKVVPHIIEVRNKAWALHRYPCLGCFSFLSFAIAEHPLYSTTILPRLTQAPPQTLLDLGCCFGHDLRRLVYDGVPSHQLYGSDLLPELMDLGYELFLDRGKIDAQFITADVFDNDSKLKDVDGQFDMIHASSFFHLFTWDRQHVAAKRVIRLLKPGPGSLILGWQIGADEATDISASLFYHNLDTWKLLWEKVGAETGTRWEVRADLSDLPQADNKDAPFFSIMKDRGMRLMKFSVMRVV